jgi:hypothetical protein
MRIHSSKYLAKIDLIIYIIIIIACSVTLYCYVAPIGPLLAGIGLLSASFAAYIRWVHERRRFKFGFLILNLTAHIIKNSDGLLLVCIIVGLQNKGEVKISARTHGDISKEEKEFLYDDVDHLDQYKHAGTLKIRKVPDDFYKKTNVFDWYSIPPTKNMKYLIESNFYDNDLEQISYLNEFEGPKRDSKKKYRDVNYWLEPRESSSPQVMIWLEPGTYAIKACFLGSKIKEPEEYWSITRLFHFGIDG